MRVPTAASDRPHYNILPKRTFTNRLTRNIFRLMGQLLASFGYYLRIYGRFLYKTCSGKPGGYPTPFMTLTKRLRFLFARNTTLPVPITSSVVLASVPAVADKSTGKEPENEVVPPVTLPTLPGSGPLPNWLSDDELLRDEGVLFGLSNARPDGKLTQIRAAFTQQAAPFDEAIKLYTEKMTELNGSISQRENHILSLRDQLKTVQGSQPSPAYLIRTVASLCLSVTMCVGNFYLIDVTLQPSFPNRWITVGVFLSGMFNLFGRTSFFYETDSRIPGRRIIEEVGPPLAAAVFILVHSLQAQPVGLAIGLFIFVFCLFLLSGKLLFSTLSALQNDLITIQNNRQLIIRKQQQLPLWESDIKRLEQEVDAIREQKWPITVALTQAQTNLNRLNAQRDRLVNLFLSEYELAHSLRERLTEQQAKAMMTGAPMRL